MRGEEARQGVRGSAAGCEEVQQGGESAAGWRKCSRVEKVQRGARGARQRVTMCRWVGRGTLQKPRGGQPADRGQPRSFVAQAAP